MAPAVTLQTVDPTPTAVVAATTTWADFPSRRKPMLDTVWRIRDTHDAIRNWCAANGRRLAGAHWEIYGDPDPVTGAYAVDVFWSVIPP